MIRIRFFVWLIFYYLDYKSNSLSQITTKNTFLKRKEKKPTKEVAKRAALNETLSYKTTYADMFKWNARVKNHTDYNLIKKYYGKGT